VSRLDCLGSAPAPRWGHTLSPVGNRLYMFGGALSPTICTNDLFLFETGSCVACACAACAACACSVRHWEIWAHNVE
jgi:hypothetical protein